MLARQNSWLPVLGSIALVAVASGCVYQGVPGHGGGKRFYYEQEALAAAARTAVEQLSWGTLSGKKVNLFIVAIGDEGGGVAMDGGLDILGVFGGGAAEQVGDAGVAGGAVTNYSTQDFYGAYAFANARDIDYLKALVMESIFKAGGMVARDDADLAGDVYVIVDNFGINRWKWDFVVYNEIHLSASVRLSAFFVDRNGEYSALGGDSRRFRYMANYVLGRIGPWNRGREVTEEAPLPKLY